MSGMSWQGALWRRCRSSPHHSLHKLKHTSSYAPHRYHFGTSPTLTAGKGCLHRTFGDYRQFGIRAWTSIGARPSHGMFLPSAKKFTSAAVDSFSKSSRSYSMALPRSLAGLSYLATRTSLLRPMHWLRRGCAALTPIGFAIYTQHPCLMEALHSHHVRPIQPTEAVVRKHPHRLSKRKRGRSLLRNFRRCIIQITNAVWISLRAISLAIRFFPMVLLFPLSSYSSIRPLWSRLLVYNLEAAGPTFIKLGQWAGTRPDIFSQEVCDSLSRLHERVEQTMEWGEVEKVIEESLGFTVDQMFEEITTTPIGCGCITQVYRGRLRTSEPGKDTDTFAASPDEDGKGQIVAVKVVRYGVRKSIETDLKLMDFGARILSSIPFLNLRFLSAEDAIAEFRASMLKQLDLRKEADHLERFAELFSENPNVWFPAPIRAFVTKDVLVETFETGVTVSEFFASQEKLRLEVGRVGLTSFLEMVLKHNFVHADLHPGNMLVRVVDNTREGRGEGGAKQRDVTLDVLGTDKQNAAARTPFNLEQHRVEVVYIDAGLVTVLGGEDRRNFIDLFKAVAEGDGDKAGRLMIERSRVDSCIDVSGFRTGMKRLVDGAVGESSFQLASVKIGEVLMEVMRLVRTYEVSVDANFTTLVTAICILEGIGRQLNPNQDIFLAAMPFLRLSEKVEMGKSVLRGVNNKAR